jgi:hypothetical protein
LKTLDSRVRGKSERSGLFPKIVPISLDVNDLGTWLLNQTLVPHHLIMRRIEPFHILSEVRKPLKGPRDFLDNGVLDSLQRSQEVWAEEGVVIEKRDRADCADERPVI